jgi:acyl-CoA thioester hydrolase
MAEERMADVPRYTLSFRVADADIDPQGHVNNVAFLRIVQDAAIAHWRAIAPDEIRAAFTWVVRRHEIEYLRLGLPGDELVVRTWVGEPSGATWERFTEIGRAGEERPLVTARTVWVLLDAATGRPRRVDANLIACFAKPASGGRNTPVTG